ncbi:MAG: adenosylmethionine--8-amino-7-oxononanoate transaminase [Bacteroidetes bacterium]|nr:adenosylmethionine--8-amino-7-oxononanoate transaminase [Bacteroidota bacterium]
MTLAERDRQSIWHPYTQHKNMTPPIPIVRGEKTLLFDEYGNSYIDAISSWWVNIHGHAHPSIARKIFEQASTLEHVIFTGFTHEPAVRLAERLLKILPGDFSKIFYSDNGSTAVEVAIKMSIQYWRNTEPEKNNKPSRNKILAFRHAYHGDTFGAMSVSDRSIFTAAFDDYLFEVVFIDTPTSSNITSLKQKIGEYKNEIACFIYEPLLQAAGGMRMYEAVMLDELLAFIKSQDIICIGDEVMTGFGRTGKLFAGEYMQHKADIICLSKGLTGGSLAMGITASSQKIFDAFLSDDKSKTFFHGHSYTANPIACAAALASLDLTEGEDCKNQIQDIIHHHKNFIDQFARENKDNITFRNIRQLGTIIAFEIDKGDDSYLNNISAVITLQALRKGIYLRPLGNTVYLMPPYCINEEELEKVYVFLKSLTRIV